ncbi:MAG TPA: hypothetical protein VGI35_10575, partial [Steroidobacteraceae bacterium]
MKEMRSPKTRGSARVASASVASAVIAASMLTACAAFGPPRTPPNMGPPSHYSVAPASPQVPADQGPPQQLVLGAAPVP